VSHPEQTSTPEPRSRTASLGEPILEIKDLKVTFPTEDGLVKAVDGLSVSISPRETLGVVGESGSGKSVTFLTVMGLVTKKEARISGQALFMGEDLLTMPAERLRQLRGDKIAMIFQDPLTALNPVHRVGNQISEVFEIHRGTSRSEGLRQAVELLGRVGIPKPAERIRSYPHEFSGGMRQRAMIAMSLALSPDLLIADEPTTALDVTVQAQILDLIDGLKSEFNAAVVMITHDLGVVAEHCENIMVMYAGKPVEYGDRFDIYDTPQHPYTWGLLQSISRMDEARTERLRPIKGQPPSLINVPKGCSFNPRCPYVFDRCRTEIPALLAVDGHHASACHLPFAERTKILNEEVLTKS
jgi:peptide/nickel transport system ATP-binding protein